MIEIRSTMMVVAMRSPLELMKRLMGKTRHKLIWAVAWVGITGVAGCERADENPEDFTLTKQPLNQKPNAQPPTVFFSSDLQTEDATLNRFIEDALSICARGDYDAFRQLFASAYTPPIEADFQRIWQGVKSVQIVSVHADRQEPPNYYVHAVVQLRQPDARGRSRRDAVVAAFREGDEWRLSPPPKEVIHKILVVDSRPAGESPREKPGRAVHTSQPSTSPGV